MTEVMFKKGTKVVYPTHGVGSIEGIETQKIGGTEVTTYVVKFEDKNRMTLRIPVTRAGAAGLRALSTDLNLAKMAKVLKMKPKVSRGMWSRRAKEYEAKINSGNIESLAEVVRDLHKNVDDPDRSYSERMIYENALERLSGEVAAVKKVERESATKVLVKTLNESLKKYKVAAEEKEAEAA